MANTDMFKYLSRNSPRFGVVKRGRPISGVKVVESADSKKPAAYGGPATRKVAGEAGSGAEVTYPRYQVPTGVEAGEQEIYTDENVPAEAPSERVSTPEMITERQGAITNRALGPRYERGTILGDLLGNLSSPKANPNYDPDKPIGGENVPYQGTSGLRGIFQRLGGNAANELNLGAQAEQASEWKAESALEKARKAKIEDYRTQKGIDAEIAAASDEKKRAHEVSMLEKTQQAHRDVIKAQQDFTAAQNDKERAEAWKRLESAQNHAVSMQNTALAATAAEGAAGRQLQTDIANLRKRSDEFVANNAVHFGPNGQFSRGGTVYNIPAVPPGQTAKPEVLIGPAGEGPQVNVGAGAGGITPPRSGYSLGAGIDTPQQLPPGGGVMRGGAAPAPAAPVIPDAPAPSPVADASLLGRFKSAMPSLTFNQPSGRGYQVAPLTEGDVAQQAMGQIAYPLRAAVGQQVKGQYTNPEEVAMSMEYPMPASRFRRPSAKEQAEALAAGDLIRKMYAE
jgi:hypothetical protein